MSYFDKIERCNRRDLARFRPFVVEGLQVGWLTPERAAVLCAQGDVFVPAKSSGVTFAASLDTPSARSAGVARIQPHLLATGLFGKARRELYAVKNAWSEPETFRLDRGLVAGFGVRAYGVHLNGYVRKNDGLHLWIGTRAMDSKVEPGKRDNMVAGGQPAGLSLMDNLIKECGEEAAITPELAHTAVPVSAISYAFAAPEGLKADTLFCYDLEVPAAFTPQPSEEITAFELMPVHDALAMVRDTDDCKFNVGLVILDFALRHGLLTPDTEPDYERIAQGLREFPQPLV